MILRNLACIIVNHTWDLQVFESLKVVYRRFEYAILYL